MTPEQQRIAIAEAAPTAIKLLAGIWFFMHNGVWTPCLDNDPLSDLNAMHEVEKVLKWEQRKQYHSILADVAGFSYCEADTQEDTELDWNCRICHATAAQRAEAFPRTLNLLDRIAMSDHLKQRVTEEIINHSCQICDREQEVRVYIGSGFSIGDNVHEADPCQCERCGSMFDLATLVEAARDQIQDEKESQSTEED